MGLGEREGVQQRHVDAFVDDPRVTDARVRDGGLVLGIRLGAAGGAEVIGVDAAREAVRVAVVLSLQLVEPSAAGEQQVRPCDQARLLAQQAIGGAPEARQVVHAVVDHGRRVDVGRPRQRHRGVVPQHGTLDGGVREPRVQELSKGVRLGQRGHGLRQTRCQDGHPIDVALFHPGGQVAIEDQLLHVDDAPVTCRADHQVVRPLEDEVPAEVGEADEIGVHGPRLHPADQGRRGRSVDDAPQGLPFGPPRGAAWLASMWKRMRHHPR